MASVSSATAADNTAVVVTIAAVGSVRHQVVSIHANYDEAAVGTLLVESPSGTTIFRGDVFSARDILFQQPILGASGGALIVTLGAGGAGVAGKLNVVYDS